jgi:hypothetical protein
MRQLHNGTLRFVKKKLNKLKRSLPESQGITYAIIEVDKLIIKNKNDNSNHRFNRLRKNMAHD